MKTNLRLFSLMIALFTAFVINAQTLSLPYFCGFEDAAENAQWTLNAGSAGNTATNKWYVSHAEVYAGDSALNISNDGGTTAAYSNIFIAILAYRTITLPAGTYDLSFTYYVGGENNNDGLYACWVNGSQNISSSAIQLPTWVNNTAFTLNGSKMQTLTGGWKVATQSITSTGAPMKLAFLWINNAGQTSVPPGACIDNVQISNTNCGKPTNVTATANGSSITVTWSGNASSYDLQYRAYGSPNVITVTGITGNSYTINGLGEGLYDFMVRSNCPNDTSIYSTAQNVIVYDPSAHCIDYVNLTATGTTCTYGTYTNPKQSIGVIDNGPTQQSSRHTVHFTPGETDPRTLNGLTTIPKGEVMSVRLGNWNNGSEAETVTYTYTVPANSNVIMILKYAVVFEEPGHAYPPEFNMQITNLMGQSIGSCTEATFLCDGTLSDASWHTCEAPGSYGSNSTMWWKEWTQVGFNLSQYAGQTLKICFTTKDCDYSGHFGYAYFALNCTEAAITGLSCGDVLETSVQAPDGFNYQWYKKTQPGIILGTDRTFSVTGSDTATYVCKVINKANPNCFFTLEASLLPRSPQANFTPQWSPSNCQNAVTLLNTSSVVTTRGVTSEKPEFYEWYIIDSINNDTIINGVGTESPTLPVPNEGGQYIIELVAAISGGMCKDTMHIIYNVPEIHEVHDTIDEEICQGQVYIFNGQRLTTTGQYQSTGKAIGGCDSIVTLNLTVVDQIATDVYDTICSDSVYVFNGNRFTKTGDYKSKLTSAAGCDSLVTLHLFVFNPVVFDTASFNEAGAPRTGRIELSGMQPGWCFTVNGDSLICLDSLSGGSYTIDSLTAGQYTIVAYNEHGCASDPVLVELKRVCVNAIFPQVPNFCGDDTEGVAPFRITSGVGVSYNLRYDAAALAQKFVNVDTVQIDTTLNLVTIHLPDTLARADRYHVDVEFNDVICGPTTVPLDYVILYPEAVIEQRWNDVLAVLTNKYNYEGHNPGYDFIQFQWYKDGVLMPGETHSYIYLGEGNVFDNVSTYSVELTRAGESYSIMSCEKTPVPHADDTPVIIVCVGCSMNPKPSASLALGNITAPGYATWYSMTGQLVARYHIDENNPEVITPSASGIYLLEVTSGSARQTFKVLVNE